MNVKYGDITLYRLKYTLYMTKSEVDFIPINTHRSDEELFRYMNEQQCKAIYSAIIWIAGKTPDVISYGKKIRAIFAKNRTNQQATHTYTNLVAIPINDITASEKESLKYSDCDKFMPHLFNVTYTYTRTRLKVRTKLGCRLCPPSYRNISTKELENIEKDFSGLWANWTKEQCIAVKVFMDLLMN